MATLTIAWDNDALDPEPNERAVDEDLQYSTKWFSDELDRSECRDREYSEQWEKNTRQLLLDIHEMKRETGKDSSTDSTQIFRKCLCDALHAEFPTAESKQLAKRSGAIIESLRRILTDIHRSMSHSDVVVRGPDGHADLRAHSDILRAHSQLCRALFSEYWWAQREETAVMYLDETAYFDQFPMLLEYFYTGNLNSILQSGRFIPALLLALEVSATSLVDELLPHVYPLIDAENATSLLTLADLNGFSELKDRCVSFILRRLCDSDLCRELNVQLTAEATAAMRTLRVAFAKSATINGDVYGEVKELVYMLRDAHAEAESIYAVSKARNDDELQECRHRQAELNRAVVLTKTICAKMESLQLFEDRLLKVQKSLLEQRRRLDESAKYNKEQRAALELIFSQPVTML